MKYLREYFSNAIIIGLAMAFLVHFCLIAKYGQQTIQEPNLAILGAEITLMIGLIAFGVSGIVKYYKEIVKSCRNKQSEKQNEINP